APEVGRIIGFQNLPSSTDFGFLSDRQNHRLYIDAPVTIAQYIAHYQEQYPKLSTSDDATQ
ncbi:hypothetical protein, partial [Pseudomonas sp.]|uniref:hypothetical protein n=1 Tax=Pseudomonas sp. TaxID=306 RepID=UPI002582E2FA